MSLDDLIKGVSLFNDGMTRYKVAQATNEAAQQLQQIASSEELKGDLQARLNAQTQVSNQLALKMAGAGADASHIVAAANRIGVSAGEQAQMGLVPAATRQSEKFQSAQQDKLFQQQKELEAMKLAAMKEERGHKSGKEEVAFVQKEAAPFNKTIEKSRTAIGFADELDNLLDAKNPIADQASKRIAGRAASEVGRMPMSEISLFTGDPAATAKISQAANEMANGKFTEHNRELLRGLSSVLRQSHLNTIMKERSIAAQGLVNKGKLAGYDLNVDDAAEMLYPSASLKKASGFAAPPPDQGSAGRALAPEDWAKIMKPADESPSFLDKVKSLWQP